MTDTRVRKTKRADELEPGDWIAAGRYNQNRIDGTDDAKVLFIQRHGETMVSLMIQEHTIPQPELIHLGSAFEVPLLSDHEVAALRADGERAERIAEIRSLADWLEANPRMPMPYSVSGYESFDNPDEAANVAKVRELAAQLNLTVDDRLDDRTGLTMSFGRAEYKLIAWHKGGRPADLADADPTGLGYSRTDDEADDPRPVSPGRVPLHTGAMTERGLVDETSTGGQ